MQPDICQCGEVMDAARDLAALWRAQKIYGATRAERNAAIEGARARLHRAVDEYAASVNAQPIS